MTQEKGPGQQPPKLPAPEAPSHMTPENLAARMGITGKRLRAILRSDYPRKAEVKGKRWELPMDLAKKVQEDYKAKKAKAEAEKQEAIKAQLAGKEK